MSKAEAGRYVPDYLYILPGKTGCREERNLQLSLRYASKGKINAPETDTQRMLVY